MSDSCILYSFILFKMFLVSLLSFMSFSSSCKKKKSPFRTVTSQASNRNPFYISIPGVRKAKSVRDIPKPYANTCTVAIVLVKFFEYNFFIFRPPSFNLCFWYVTKIYQYSIFCQSYSFSFWVYFDVRS